MVTSGGLTGEDAIVYGGALPRVDSTHKAKLIEVQTEEWDGGGVCWGVQDECYVGIDKED